MVDLREGYEGSSCVIKAKNNDLITMGVLRRIGKNYIDIGNSRNEFPSIPYNLLVKIEIYNTREGFRVLIGRTYLSSSTLARITDLNEATNDERREYFRISIRDEGLLYNCFQGKGEIDSSGDGESCDGFKVQLIDISLGGLLFKTRKTFRIDDRFNIMIPAMGDSMIFTCAIRRRIDRPEGGCGYGCEFLEMSTMQEDLLYRYILKNQSKQLRRMR